jgi:DNA-binding FadR family transcriptional regulator
MSAITSKKSMLTKEISQSLKDMVISGQLGPGDKLPNEMDLASMMGVSRSTVREAVKELVAASVLEIVRGKGTFVCMHPGWKHDPLGVEFMAKGDLLLMLFETRMLVEPGVAYIAAERASAINLEKIRDSLERMKTMMENHEDHSKEDLEFPKHWPLPIL